MQYISPFGTNAPFYMDLITMYVAFLPLFLALSIYFAVKQKYKTHLISQAIILSVSLCVILYFEVMTRLENKFLEYVDQSNFSFDFLIIYLVIHIIIATASLAGWVYLFIVSYKAYKKDEMNSIRNSKHKKIGKAIFTALTITSLMGILMYLFLFVL